MIIASHMTHLGAKDLGRCERPPYPWTLSTFQGGPLREVDLGTITHGIVTSGSSHQRSYHYHSRSIEDLPWSL